MSLSDQILQYIVNGISVGAVYALIALGFTIIYKATDIINFAQGEFVMLGAMFMITLWMRGGVPGPLSFIISVLAVSAIAALLEIAAIRPVRGGSIITLIIITIGASIAIRGAAMLIWGRNGLPLKPFSSSEPIRITESVILLPQEIWILLIATLSMLCLYLFFEKTLTGKAMMACAANRKAAKLVGINVDKMVLMSFVLSGSLGAISGIAIAPNAQAQYDMGVLLGIKGFCAAILGGLGSNVGAVIGGLMLGVIQELGAGFLSSGYKNAIAFLILLAVLIFRPKGMMGK